MQLVYHHFLNTSDISIEEEAVAHYFLLLKLWFIIWWSYSNDSIFFNYS